MSNKKNSIKDQLLKFYEKINNPDLVSKDDIEEMYLFILEYWDCFDSVDINYEIRFTIVAFIGQYGVNKNDTTLGEKLIHQYLQISGWTDYQRCLLNVIYGAILTDKFDQTKDCQLLLQAEDLFKMAINSNILSGMFLREAKRNLCTNIKKQKNPNKYFELLQFSYFYDTSIYFYQLNQYNKNMFCDCKFMQMIKNDYSCPIDELFINDIPDKLYKYRIFDRDKKNINSLKEFKLYLSGIDDFNDPFDPPFRAYPEYNKYIDILFPQGVIGCLSAINNSILMWSHYADSHKGFCIEYDVSEFKKNLPKYTTVRKVRYFDHFSIDLKTPIDTDEYFHSILDMCALKHKDWEYEKEYRILSHQDSNFIELPISRIYLGKDISESNKLIILQLCNRKNIPVCQYVSDPKNVFALSIDQN